MASVAAGPQNSGNVNYFFHIIVFLCITFLFGKLDPIAPLTPFGMNTIGVFLGVIYAWVFIDIIWPSMVGLLALMLLDVLPATALLNKGFGDPTVIMMMFIFVMVMRPFFLLFLAQKRFLILKGSVAAAYEDIIFACNCLEIPKHIVQGGYGGLSQGKIFIRDHIG